MQTTVTFIMRASRLDGKISVWRHAGGIVGGNV
jgi:hypothetical protein